LDKNSADLDTLDNDETEQILDILLHFLDKKAIRKDGGVDCINASVKIGIPLQVGSFLIKIKIYDLFQSRDT
jgi:hypothetical protein